MKIAQNQFNQIVRHHNKTVKKINKLQKKIIQDTEKEHFYNENMKCTIDKKEIYMEEIKLINKNIILNDNEIEDLKIKIENLKIKKNNLTEHLNKMKKEKKECENQIIVFENEKWQILEHKKELKKNIKQENKIQFSLKNFLYKVFY